MRVVLNSQATSRRLAESVISARVEESCDRILLAIGTGSEKDRFSGRFLVMDLTGNSVAELDLAKTGRSWPARLPALFEDRVQMDHEHVALCGVFSDGHGALFRNNDMVFTFEGHWACMDHGKLVTECFVGDNSECLRVYDLRDGVELASKSIPALMHIFPLRSGFGFVDWYHHEPSYTLWDEKLERQLAPQLRLNIRNIFTIDSDGRTFRIQDHDAGIEYVHIVERGEWVMHSRRLPIRKHWHNFFHRVTCFGWLGFRPNCVRLCAEEGAPTFEGRLVLPPSFSDKRTHFKRVFVTAQGLNYVSGDGQLFLWRFRSLPDLYAACLETLLPVKSGIDLPLELAQDAEMLQNTPTFFEEQSCRGVEFGVVLQNKNVCWLTL